MSDREPVKEVEPTPTEFYAAGYAEGVRDGAERADQWASNKYGLNGGIELVAWILELLPASRDELAKRMR